MHKTGKRTACDGCVNEKKCGRPRARPVLTKRDFVVRYSKGEFGNAVPTWGTIDEFERSGYGGLVHIRNRTAGGPTLYDVAASELPSAWASFAQLHGLREADVYFSAMAPEARKLFQGEVLQTTRHLSLTYNLLPMPMREAFARQTLHAHGLQALGLLKYYLCPNSYEWMQYLLDEYGGHVVEFSTYSVYFGTLPRYNTIFWEVRLY